MYHSNITCLHIRDEREIDRLTFMRWTTQPLHVHDPVNSQYVTHYELAYYRWKRYWLLGLTCLYCEERVYPPDGLNHSTITCKWQCKVSRGGLFMCNMVAHEFCLTCSETLSPFDPLLLWVQTNIIGRDMFSIEVPRFRALGWPLIQVPGRLVNLWLDELGP